MLILMGGCFLRDFSLIVHLLFSLVFHAICAFSYTDEPNDIRKKFASSNLAHSSVISNACSFREGYPRELAHGPGYSQ